VVHDVGSGNARFAVAIEIGAFERVGDDDEFIGTRKWQRSQQYTFDNGEDRRGRANAEGEHEDGRDGESRAFEQMTNSDLQVMQHGEAPPADPNTTGLQIRMRGSDCSVSTWATEIYLGLELIVVHPTKTIPTRTHIRVGHVLADS